MSQEATRTVYASEYLLLMLSCIKAQLPDLCVTVMTGSTASHVRLSMKPYVYIAQTNYNSGRPSVRFPFKGIFLLLSLICFQFNFNFLFFKNNLGQISFQIWDQSASPNCQIFCNVCLSSYLEPYSSDLVMSCFHFGFHLLHEYILCFCLVDVFVM